MSGSGGGSPGTRKIYDKIKNLETMINNVRNSTRASKLTPHVFQKTFSSLQELNAYFSTCNARIITIKEDRTGGGLLPLNYWYSTYYQIEGAE